MVVANLLISWLGPWFSPINAFVLIGLDMVIRDRLHDKWFRENLYVKMFGLIAFSGAITYILNPAAGTIALASSVAFVGAMITNTLIYQTVHKREWLIRSNTSNLGGSAVDSVLFPTVAFGTLMPEIIALQFMAKVFGGFIWSIAFKKIMGLR
jgi:hypothetical protein